MLVFYDAEGRALERFPFLRAAFGAPLPCGRHPVVVDWTPGARGPEAGVAGIGDGCRE